MTTAVVASSQQPPAPAGMFSFLKHGFTIPARRPGLFLSVFALHAALSTALLAFNNLAGRLVVAAAMKQSSETNIISTSKEADADADAIVAWLTVYAAATAAYAAMYLSVALVKKVATATAAVAAHSSSGEPEPHQNHHTLGFGSFMRKVRRVSGTVVLGAVLRTACAAAVAASVLALPAIVFYWRCSVLVVLLDAVLAVIAFLFYLYLDVVCDMAVVAAASAAGGGGGGGAMRAVAQAWRAMAAGTGARAVVYAVVTMALSVAVGSVSQLAVSRLLPQGMEVSLVEGGVKYVLGFVVEVFSVAAVTGYYFECREREEGKAGHKD